MSEVNLTCDNDAHPKVRDTRFPFPFAPARVFPVTFTLRLEAHINFLPHFDSAFESNHNISPLSIKPIQ